MKVWAPNERAAARHVNGRALPAEVSGPIDELAEPRTCG